MKKLFLALALLMIGFSYQSAFAAVTYPSCNNGGSVNNGTTKDRFNVHGWCIDDYGVLTPQTGMAVVTGYPNSIGGMAIPISNYNVGTNAGGVAIPATTFDVLIAQQTGNVIVDYGGYSTTATIDSLKGSGGHFMLPAAMPGEQYTVISASQSVITVDTMTTGFAASVGVTYPNSDTIEFSPNGTGMTAGQSIKSPGNAGASVTLVSNVAGQWQIKDMQGQIGGIATSDSLWTVISTQ